MPSKKSTRQSKINRLSTQSGRAGIKNTTISHYTHSHTHSYTHTHTTTAWHISAYAVRPSQLPFYGERFKFFMQAATADSAIVSLPLSPSRSCCLSCYALYTPSAWSLSCCTLCSSSSSLPAAHKSFRSALARIHTNCVPSVLLLLPASCQSPLASAPPPPTSPSF